jgi:translation initiation factor IF-3
MKPKIPIYLKGRLIAKIEDGYALKSRVYDKWSKIYSITKVYHDVTGKRVILETWREKPYVVQGI